MENGGDPEHFTDGQAEKDRYHKINWKRSPLITCMHTYTGWPALPNATLRTRSKGAFFRNFSQRASSVVARQISTIFFSRAGPGKATRPDSLAAGKHSPVENSWSQLP